MPPSSAHRGDGGRPCAYHSRASCILDAFERHFRANTEKDEQLKEKLVLRLYYPKVEAYNGKWTKPQLKRVQQETER